MSRHHKVLLIHEVPDDSPHLGTRLRAAGVDIIVASSDVGVFSGTCQVVPDLIALDIRSQGDHRLLDLGRLRRQPALALVPVIVFGYGADRLPEFAELAGEVLFPGTGALGPTVALERLAPPELIRSTVLQLLG